MAILADREIYEVENPYEYLQLFVYLSEMTYGVIERGQLVGE